MLYGWPRKGGRNAGDCCAELEAASLLVVVDAYDWMWRGKVQGGLSLVERMALECPAGRWSVDTGLDHNLDQPVIETDP
jgi:hypothetical protein